MQEYRIEDQGQWERSRSSRRMFLALTGAGKENELTQIGKQLLRMLKAHLAGSPQERQAKFYWKNGLTDPDSNQPEKELADRCYLVMRCAADGFQRHKSRLNPHGKKADWRGEVIVCDVIRAEVPLSPNGFRKVAKLAVEKSLDDEQPTRTHSVRFIKMLAD